MLQEFVALNDTDIYWERMRLVTASALLKLLLGTEKEWINLDSLLKAIGKLISNSNKNRTKSGKSTDQPQILNQIMHLFIKNNIYCIS